jgi:hypothetical protein
MEHQTDQIASYLVLLSGRFTNRQLWSCFSALASVLDHDGAFDAFQQFLREFTIEWIDSGFQEDGSEWPLQRNFAPKPGKVVAGEVAVDDCGLRLLNLKPAPHAVQAMASYAGGNLNIEIPRSASERHAYEIVPSTTIRSEGRPPTMVILPNGGFHYRPSLGLPNFGCYAAGEGDDQEDLRKYLEILAASFFMEFFQSAWRFRLMRCRKCGTFAVPKRKPLKRYEYGWHCKSCRSAATATARVKKQATKHRQRWLSLAAEAWLRWESKKRKEERAIWIADEVNRQFKRGEPWVMRNSITRNASLIAGMAEKLRSGHVDPAVQS